MIRSFAERSQILIPRPSDICTICQAHVEKLPEDEIKRVKETLPTPLQADMDPSVKATKLSRHIAAHLKMLAFRSLHGILTEFDEDPNAQDSDKATHGQGQDDVSELCNQVYSDLDNISISSYDIPPDNRILMSVQNDRITQEDPGKRYREHCLKLEPTNRVTSKWYLVEQQSGQIAEHFRNWQDPILQHFRRHRFWSDREQLVGPSWSGHHYDTSNFGKLVLNLEVVYYVKLTRSRPRKPA